MIYSLSMGVKRGEGYNVAVARNLRYLARPADDRLRPEDRVLRSVDSALLAGRPGADLPHARPDGHRRLGDGRTGGAGWPPESQGLPPHRLRSGRTRPLVAGSPALTGLPRILPDPTLLRQGSPKCHDRGVTRTPARAAPGAPGALPGDPAAPTR